MAVILLERNRYQKFNTRPTSEGTPAPTAAESMENDTGSESHHSNFHWPVVKMIKDAQLSVHG